jgi:DNA-directed RNA polymerase subunit L
MQLEILKDEKDELRLRFDTRDQGFLNLIKEAVWKQSGVEMAGFKIEHPEIGMPEFVLKTKGKKAKDVWNAALETIADDLDKFGVSLKKLK